MHFSRPTPVRSGRAKKRYDRHLQKENPLYQPEDFPKIATISLDFPCPSRMERFVQVLTKTGGFPAVFLHFSMDSVFFTTSAARTRHTAPAAPHTAWAGASPGTAEPPGKRPDSPGRRMKKAGRAAHGGCPACFSSRPAAESAFRPACAGPGSGGMKQKTRGKAANRFFPRRSNRFRSLLRPPGKGGQRVVVFFFHLKMDQQRQQGPQQNDCAQNHQFLQIADQHGL